MQLDNIFPWGGTRFKLSIKWLNYLLLGFSGVMAWPLPSSAIALDVHVANGVGGHVSLAADGSRCFNDCVMQGNADTVTSLFAIPDRGYHFQGWGGDCASAKGPLCTLKPNRNAKLAAHFVKMTKPDQAAKVLLLLHDKGGRKSVWNELVKRQFDNRCADIYGGFILGEDAIKKTNQVHCYRVVFGYYDFLGHANNADGALGGKDGQTDSRVADGQAANEILAAVIGIQNRYHGASISLVGEGQAVSAAEAFLATETACHADIVGLLALKSARRNGRYAGDKVLDMLKKITYRQAYSPVLALDANPEHVGKIVAGLTQMSGAWWLDQW